MLTRAPDGVPSVKLAECVSDRSGQLEQMLAEDGACPAGYIRERTAGWLFADPQPGTIPVYRCRAEPVTAHFVSNRPDCEGGGEMEFHLG